MRNDEMRIVKLGLGESGAALILALLMITILVVLVLETMRGMQVEGAGARYFQDSFQAEALAKSGVQLAIALLKTDMEDNRVDHLGESWALLPQPEVLPVELPDPGILMGNVVDETGKFPINSLVNKDGKMSQVHQQALERLLANPPFQMETEDARGLVMAIKDWLDQDNEATGDSGAEADYYENLDRPHSCKNGPLDSLSELLLIRGVSDELYYGKGDEPGLKDLLTVYSEGKININTAGQVMLQALVTQGVPQETAADWAESVIAYRQEEIHWDFLGESDWYRNRMPGFNDISLHTDLITTKSSHFSVQMSGKVGAGRKSVFAQLERQSAMKEGEDQVTVSVRFWQVY
jgi:general secretion pathway protein K